MTQESTVLAQTEGEITTLTINRPKALNALNSETLLALEAAIDALDPSCRVVIITGSGEKSFVAGADIKEMASLSAVEAARFAGIGHRVFARLESLEIPTIAAVNGFALGGGCELMLSCDFAIASDNARFGQPEVGLGVIPGFGGTVRLGRRVGPAMAKQLLYTGAPVKAPEALRIGLVNEVMPQAELMPRAQKIAQQIVKSAPLAVRWAKESCRMAAESNTWTACKFEQELFGLCFSTEDQTEGMGAFVEKRAASWKGV